VGAASRSYYGALLEAGVEIYEYVGGLLHAKTLTVDGQIALVGSANMDRRSFDLNYENNILLIDRRATADLYQRQQLYLASARPVAIEDIAGLSMPHRLWINTVAMLGPVL
jgi:cardiolipin synthase